MKKLFYILAVIMMLCFVFTGCQPAQQEPIQPEPADAEAIPITSSADAATLAEYLAGNTKGDYLVEQDAAFDLTGITVSGEKTILLQNAALTLTGTYTAGSGSIVVRNFREGSATLDLSMLNFSFEPAAEPLFFDVKNDVTLIAPKAQDNISVVTGDEWISVKAGAFETAQQPEEQPGENDPADNGHKIAATANELLQYISDPTIKKIELSRDITVTFDGETLSRGITLIPMGHMLTLNGTLAFAGDGLLYIDAGMDEAAALDLSGFSVSADALDTTGMPAGSLDLVRIGMHFKQIKGKPTLPENMEFTISDDGTQAFVFLKIAPDTAAQIKKDMPLILSGELDDGEYRAVYVSDTTDGVLEVRLDNPTIAREISVNVGGGVTLKVTGSVTFDGGLYRFEFAEGEGRATVDLTELEIKGTPAVGKTKSDNIVFWRERNGVDVLYDQSDRHVTYSAGGSGNEELRYVQ
ncbi:MAG: hypothetical protein PHO41_08460 [Eubacteriales bacterium]|nr:hypothetical protein [Eubacteriales bacterium]